MAAAGLARCRALLEAMCVLIEAGRADTIGVLLRSLFEVWLVSLYVLLKGDLEDAGVLEEMAAEEWKRSKAMFDCVGAPQNVKDHLEEWRKELDVSGAKPRPNLEAIAQQLTKLLPADSSGKAPNVQSTYDIIYRAESQYSAHPSVGLLLRYHSWDPKEERDAVVLNPGPPFSRQELVGLHLTLYLAFRVFGAFGIVTDERLEDLDVKVGNEMEELNRRVAESA
jgi:hypothetical protein